MKKVEAIIRPERLSAVREVLDKNGFPGMSATEIKGRGRQKGVSLQWRAGDYKVEFLPKVKLEVVVEDGDADRIVDLICDAAHTGEAGDGKIFVYPVVDVVRVRTKERAAIGGVAIAMGKGGGRGEGSDEGEGVGGGVVRLRSFSLSARSFPALRSGWRRDLSGLQKAGLEVKRLGPS